MERQTMLDSLLIFGRTGTALQRVEDFDDRSGDRAVCTGYERHPDAEGVTVRVNPGADTQRRWMPSRWSGQSTICC